MRLIFEHKNRLERWLPVLSCVLENAIGIEEDVFYGHGSLADLDVLENQALLDSLNSERFMDTAPAAVHATLLDEGHS